MTKKASMECHITYVIGGDAVAFDVAHEAIGDLVQYCTEIIEHV